METEVGISENPQTCADTVTEVKRTEPDALTVTVTVREVNTIHPGLLCRVAATARCHVTETSVT